MISFLALWCEYVDGDFSGDGDNLAGVVYLFCYYLSIYAMLYYAMLFVHAWIGLRWRGEARGSIWRRGSGVA